MRVDPLVVVVFATLCALGCAVGSSLQLDVTNIDPSEATVSFLEARTFSFSSIHNLSGLWSLNTSCKSNFTTPGISVTPTLGQDNVTLEYSFSTMITRAGKFNLCFWNKSSNVSSGGGVFDFTVKHNVVHAKWYGAAVPTTFTLGTPTQVALSGITPTNSYVHLASDGCPSDLPEAAVAAIVDNENPVYTFLAGKEGVHRICVFSSCSKVNVLHWRG